MAAKILCTCAGLATTIFFVKTNTMHFYVVRFTLVYIHINILIRISLPGIASRGLNETNIAISAVKYNQFQFDLPYMFIQSEK